jgi:hypothetical protein
MNTTEKLAPDVLAQLLKNSERRAIAHQATARSEHVLALMYQTHGMPVRAARCQQVAATAAGWARAHLLLCLDFKRELEG